MKKILISMIIFCSALTGLSAQPSFSAGIGGDFFNYDKNFLDMSSSMVVPIAEGMEFNLGVNFGIATESDGGDVDASFYVPFDLGLNFVFSEEQPLHYLVGVGLTPQFLFDDGTDFYMGPYVRGGIRAQVHEYMKWFLELQQDLVIGAPDWINTVTRVKTGILFNLGS
jgi:hypothetical protein